MSINTSLNLSDRMSLDFEDFTELSPDVSPPFLSGWTWACDTKGRYTSCSPEVVEILGIHARDFEGQELASFALPEKSAGLLKAALEKGTFPVEVRLHFRRSDGTLLPAAVHLLPTHSQAGDHSGIHGFTITLFTQDEGLPQEEEVIPEQEATQKAAPIQTQIHNVASALILDMLDDLQASSPVIAKHPKSSVTVNEVNGSALLDFNSGNGHNTVQEGLLVEIEHKLKWGNKFDFDYDEDLFIRRSKYSRRGFRGYMERIAAPQKIQKCDLHWFAVMLRVDADSAQVWVDYAQAGDEPLKINLADFLENPNLLKPEIEMALENPLESSITYRLGMDYLVAPDRAVADERLQTKA